MKVKTSELKAKKILEESKKTEPERRFHPKLDGFFTEEEAKKELQNRAKNLTPEK